MNKYIKFFLSFFIPVCIFCICLALNKIAPFGINIITVYDARHQYPAFFSALKNFHFYSLNLGLGFNLLGTATYYLMSPLNLLIHFFDIYHYNTFYFLLIIIKIGLCGLSMQYFLSKEEKSNTLWSTIFSIIYALIGYIASYYYNIFWLDGIILLPFVLVGINNIIYEKSPLFYIVSLSISIILSYYTGYMSCIFSVIYFIYKLVETEKYKNKKIIIRFIISSLLIGLVCCIVLIPSFYALMNGKAEGYSYEFTNYWAFNKNIMYLFYSLTPGNFHPSFVVDGFAQNFCTLFVAVLFFTSFFNKKISKKTKTATLIIILFYLISYSFNLIDYAWQFFQKPVWWQHRYSFTLSTFMIIIANKNITNYEKLNISMLYKIIIFGISSLLMIAGFYFFYQSLSVKSIFRLFSIIFSILLLINYIFLFDNKSKANRIIIIILIICELLLNTFICIKANNKQNTLSYDITSKQKTINNIKNMKKIDNSFYRSELINPITSNDGLLFDYYGLNYFNSLRNKQMINLVEDYLGIYTESHSKINIYKFDPYIISLLDIKYLIGETEPYYYSKVADNIYLNKNSIGLGFMVNKDLKNIKLKEGYYHNNVSKIYSTMLNEKYNLYHTLDNTNITLENAHYNSKKHVYSKNDKDKDAIINIDFTAMQDSLLIIDYYTLATKVYINDEEIIQNKTYTYMKKGDKIHIEHPFIQKDENISIGTFHYIDIDELETICSKLSKNTLHNIKTNSNHHLFEAAIDVENNDELLFTSIVYEKGMIIKVNGHKVSPTILLGSLIGLELNKGTNKITIDYIPQGLILGIITFAIGIILTTIFIKKFKSEKN